MNFFDSWFAFNTCFDQENLTALTQLVGYKLLAVDNELQHPESFLLSDRELMSRTNIKSGQTIVEARRQLKNAGLIDFKAGKGTKPTRYTIKRESSTNQALIKRKVLFLIPFNMKKKKKEMKTMTRARGRLKRLRWQRARTQTRAHR